MNDSKCRICYTPSLAVELGIADIYNQNWGLFPAGSREHRELLDRQRKISFSERHIQNLLEAMPSETIKKAWSEAGLSEYRSELAQAGARAVIAAMEIYEEKIQHLHIGSAESLMGLYSEIIANDVDAQRLHTTMFEPSGYGRQELEAWMKETGLKGGEDVNIVGGHYTKMADEGIIGTDTQHIVSAQEILANHPQLEPLFGQIYRVLKADKAKMKPEKDEINTNGVVIISDVFHGALASPSEVYIVLRNMPKSTTGKTEFMEVLLSNYPKIADKREYMYRGKQAKTVRKFLGAYLSLMAESDGSGYSWKIPLLGASRPVGHVIERLENSNFATQGVREYNIRKHARFGGNPYNILPDTGALYTIIGSKNPLPDTQSGRHRDLR